MQKKITLDLITKLNLTSKEQSGLDKESQLNKVLQSETIHLEWQDIPKIDNLELFSGIRTLHLQYNFISKIENLEFLTQLEYLSLEGNLILKIEGLSTLFNLLYLNLANNKITVLDLPQIPAEISILKLGGNPCITDDSYRKDAILYFKLLDELDGISVVKERLVLNGLQVPEYTGQAYEDTETADSKENFRFMNEDEDVLYSNITEATWQVVQKSRARLEEMMKIRQDFHNQLTSARKFK